MSRPGRVTFEIGELVEVERNDKRHAVPVLTIWEKNLHPDDRHYLVQFKYANVNGAPLRLWYLGHQITKIPALKQLGMQA